MSDEKIRKDEEDHEAEHQEEPEVEAHLFSAGGSHPT